MFISGCSRPCSARMPSSTFDGIPIVPRACISHSEQIRQKMMDQARYVSVRSLGLVLGAFSR